MKVIEIGAILNAFHSPHISSLLNIGYRVVELWFFEPDFRVKAPRPLANGQDEEKRNPFGEPLS